MSVATKARRLVYLVHRWTGIGACLLMVLWLVSGIVMLFVGYPRLLLAERLQALAPLDRPGCCVPVATALAQAAAPDAVRAIVLTTIAGQPRYRLQEDGGGFVVVDALTGRRLPPVDEQAALAGARAFLPGADAVPVGRVHDDRWTHSGALDAHRPLFEVQMRDADATLLYVSSGTGEVVLDAPAAQRAWNFVGAWLHWLYPFRDGSRDPVWSWTVIVLSAVGTVSALTGALAGLWRWRFRGRYKSGARTPYRELPMRWHHVAGLAFGPVLIAWIFSGLMSMNPLRVFDPAGLRPDLAAWRGGVPGSVRPGIAAADALSRLRAAGFAAVEIEWRVLAGEPYLLARDAAGGTRLIVATDTGFATTEHWPHETLAAAAPRLMPVPIRATQTLAEYDAFYYRRGAASMYAGADRGLPVLRVEFDDPGSTRVYLDPRTGDVALSVDRSQRAGRWLFNLLHSWDLPVFLKASAAREAALALLSAGALAIAVTGTVIGCRRLLRLRGRAGGARRSSMP